MINICDYNSNDFKNSEKLESIRALIKGHGYDIYLDKLQISLQTLLSFPLNQLFVSEKDKKIVGFVALAIHPLIVTPFNRCRIEILIVDKNHQRQGIGKQLVAEAEKYALTENVSIMDLSSSLKREQKGAHTKVDWKV
tara:strand:- start:738 stop:1151 length:414 start_codon:yes stop_codon:yes gene_type:complete